MKIDSRFRCFGTIAAVLFSTAVLLLGVAAGAGNAAQTDKSPIRSASEIDYSPFCIVDADGRAGGFSVELMRAALAAMGHEVTFRTGPWDKVRGWLERGEVQALPLVGHTPEREALFDFTFPYMSIHGTIVIRRDTRDIENLSDLEGRQVAVMKGDNAEEFLRREDRGIGIHTTATFDEALRKLSEGRWDAVVIQRLVALRLIQEAGLTNLRIVNKPIEGFRQDFCFAVREGDRETLALLNEGLALVMADGTYRHLHAKWFASLQLPSDRPIIIGGDHNYPPFEYLDENGRPAGFTVEMTRAIAREMNMNIQIRLGPWADVVNNLEQGDIDLIQGMFYSPDRDLRFDFTQPYLTSHYVSVARKGEGDPPATIADLAGKRIVVERGDVIYDYLVNHGLADQVSLVETQEDMLRELAGGKYDCGLAVRISSLYLIKERGWDNLNLGRNAFISREYCYAVPNNHRALLAQFSEGLKVLEQSGEYRRIYEKWMGVYTGRPLISFLRYFAMFFVPLILILMGVSLWSWSLRRQVASRTAELVSVSQRHRAILAAVPDIIMEVSPHYIYTWANQAGLDFFGNDVIGREAADYFVDDEAIYEKVQELFDGDESVVYIESWQRRKDGRKRLLAWWCRVLKDNSGMVSGALSTARDITESKYAEEMLRESERKYRELINGMNETVWVIDVDGTLIDVNDTTVEMLGYSKEELFAIGLSGIDSTLKKDDIKALAHAMPSDRLQIFETTHTAKDGRTFPVEVSSSLVTYQGKKAILSIARDITRRKRMEKQLQKTLERLRQTVTTTVQAMVSAIEIRDPYTVGHQIRTANLARAIAAEMGFDEERANTIRITGTIHDIGKLSIPAEILSKPGKLTENEFALIKEHPRRGYEILKNVEANWPLAEIVHQHHERMDGSGYPRGLKDNEILMEARIMAVADVVESMASHRPYRAALGIDAALEEIETNRGILYDDTVADACLRLFQEKGYQLP